MLLTKSLSLASIQSFLKRKETLLFIWAFAVRLGVFSLLWWWFRVHGAMPQEASMFPVMDGDSFDYYNLSQNLFHYHTFSSSLGLPLVPESFRLPGYPFLLYVFDFLPHPLLLASLVQIACGAGSVLLTYLIGRQFLSEKASWIGALLLSVEPTTLLIGSTVMSDTMFVFAMLLGMYLLLKNPPNDRSSILAALFSGFLFGYAILVRVIIQYLAILLFFSYAVIFHRQLLPARVTLLKFAVFAAGIVLVIAPWSLRNHRQFNSYTLSSTPYINVTQYNLVYFYAYQHHISATEAQHVFSDPIPYPRSSYWFRSLVNESVFKKEIADELRGNLIPYLKFHLIKTIPFFTNDSLRDINRVVGVLPQPVAQINFTDLLIQKNIGAIVRFLLTPSPALLMLAIGSTAWVLVTALWLGSAAYTLLKGWKNQQRFWFILFASGVIMYFAILSSPVIQPRYRMPAAPFMLLLGADGALLAYETIRSHKALKAALS